MTILSLNQIDSPDPVNPADLTTKNYVDQRMPTGAMVDWAGVAAPPGWFLCDGSAYSRTTYSLLFSRIGTAWGAGDGSTTFNVPDLRSRVTVGAGQGSGLTNRALATFGGEEVNGHVHGIAVHSHTLSTNGWARWQLSANFMGGYIFGTATAAYNTERTNATGIGVAASGNIGEGIALGGTSDNASLGNVGAPNDTVNMPPFAVVTKIIKY